MDHHDSGGKLSDGEEQLMVPLTKEVVIPVVEVRPPGVVVWVDAEHKQQQH